MDTPGGSGCTALRPLDDRRFRDPLSDLLAFERAREGAARRGASSVPGTENREPRTVERRTENPYASGCSRMPRCSASTPPVKGSPPHSLRFVRLAGGPVRAPPAGFGSRVRSPRPTTADGTASPVNRPRRLSLPPPPLARAPFSARPTRQAPKLAIPHRQLLRPESQAPNPSSRTRELVTLRILDRRGRDGRRGSATGAGSGI